MAIKCVILIQQVTQPAVTPVGVLGVTVGVLNAPSIGYSARQHIAGWTEYVMWNNDSVSSLLTALQTGANNQPGLLPSRAALLSQNAQVIGVRLYSGGAGKGQSFALAYPGTTGAISDNPVQAILVKVGNVNVGAVRRFTLRGVPDAQIVGGEFVPDQNYVNAVNAWMHALSNFAFIAIDPTQLPSPVFNITAAGLCTINGPAQPFLVNQIVTFNKVLDANGFKRSFRGSVTSIGPQNNQFTVAAWPFGVGTGGTVGLKAKGTFSMDYNTMNVNRLVSRRVGRPFELYRGRRSRRRR